MEEKGTFNDAIRAGATRYGVESLWTSDGIEAAPASVWLQTAQPRADEPLFTFSGNKIVRQGLDTQHYAIVLYLADQRCDRCERFLQHEPPDESAPSMITAKLCIRCVSGGIINESLFRR
jgi:hypothetical protein